MRPEEAAFVEDMGQMLGASGLPPMAGRMWGWLLICEPPEQTAAELADVLQASRGSISGTARLLVAAGMVRRTTKRGDRREYFSVPAGATSAFVMSQVPRLMAFQKLTERGLELLRDRPEAAKARVREVRDIYAFFARVYPELIERFYHVNPNYHPEGAAWQPSSAPSD